MREIIMSDEKSKAAYEELLKQYEAAHGPVTPAADCLILKVVYLEGLHDQAVGEITDKGLREQYKVSTYQSGTRENKALILAMKLQTQQSRLLKDLKLLPGAKVTAPETEDDGAHDINDY